VLRFVGPFFEQPVMIIGRRDAVLLDLGQLTGRRLALTDLHLVDGGAPRVISAVNAASAAGAPMPALVVMSAELGDADMQALREAGADLVLAKASDATLFVRQLLKHPALRGAQKEALA
jgi:CheY-like chemotaxis protein